MENKYYTPSIEEFHIGFEFQKWEVHDLYYQTLVMQDTTSLTFIKERLQEIRVKYLDEEDIKSLGFKKDTYKNSICYTNNNCQIFFFPHNMIPDHNIVSIDLFVGNYREQYFRGLIKNKSELKQILKQITDGI